MEMMKSIEAHSYLPHEVDPIGISPSQVSLQTNRDAQLPFEPFPLFSTYVHPLSVTYLQSQRIVAFRSTHRVTRAYDLLRNQIINMSSSEESPIVAVAGPAQGCGVSVTSINLALSIARISSGQVILVDANRNAPAAQTRLGLAPVDNSKDRPWKGKQLIVEAQGVTLNLLRLASTPARSSPPDELAIDLQRLRQVLKPAAMVVDLGPLLTCDEAVPVVRTSDVVVLVLATGHTLRHEVEICRSFLRPDQRVQVVLNKARRHGL